MNTTAPLIQPKRLKKLLREMLDIYSPSGKEVDLLDFLQAYLKRRRLPAVAQTVEEDRYNLLVLPEDPEDIRLAFIGHVDTVAAYDLDEYGYGESGDHITGLGAADMKGGCAAMVEAFCALWEASQVCPHTALCLVVGEEEEGDGALKLMEEYRFPWAIIAEPTELRPCLSHYGYLEVHAATLGKRMHASLANVRENAIEALLQLVLGIANHIQTQRPELVYNIRDLFSSHSGFAVPERCEAWLDIHLPPSAPIGEILTDLEEIASRERDNYPTLETTFRIENIHSGYALPEKGPVVEGIKSSYGRCRLPWAPRSFRSHSDANLLWAAGARPVLIGPGSLSYAHASDEWVSFKQVCHAAELYLDMLLHLPW